MGSMISLGVGRMEIDWGKNNFFRNHSALFQTSDVKMIPYYYVEDDGNPLIVEKEGYSRQLKLVKPRLDLLGYTLEMIEEKYNQLRSDCLCHQGIAEVGGVSSVNHTFASVFAEEFKSVYKINVLVAVCNRVIIGALYYSESLCGICFSASECGGAGDHNDREVRLLFTDYLEEGLVSCIKLGS